MCYNSRSRKRCRRGTILALAAILMVPLCGLLAFSLDMGYVYVELARLQNGADAAAVAAAGKISAPTSAANTAAIDMAELNCQNAGTVLRPGDIEYGTWDSQSRQFTAGTPSPNAVRVTCRRNTNAGNAVSLFFARVLGYQTQNLSAEAIALAPSSGAQFRFLIDDEMFNTDEQDIEDLASSEGVSPDALLSDGDGDGFIDIPPGSTLELPTGQVGDEGLFDIATYEGAFPFKESSAYTTTDFMAEGTALEQSLGTQNLQDVEWTSSQAPHSDLVGSKLLDPTPGMDPMDSHSDIAALPDPDQMYVSPVYDDDVAMAETDPSKYGSPAANIQGERRGLVAFRIISSRSHPAGGSYLPLLTIEILDPQDFDITSLPIFDGQAGEGGTVSLVR